MKHHFDFAFVASSCIHSIFGGFLRFFALPYTHSRPFDDNFLPACTFTFRVYGPRSLWFSVPPYVKAPAYAQHLYLYCIIRIWMNFMTSRCSRWARWELFRLLPEPCRLRVFLKETRWRVNPSLDRQPPTQREPKTLSCNTTTLMKMAMDLNTVQKSLEDLQSKYVVSQSMFEVFSWRILII